MKKTVNYFCMTLMTLALAKGFLAWGGYLGLRIYLLGLKFSIFAVLCAAALFMIRGIKILYTLKPVKSLAAGDAEGVIFSGNKPAITLFARFNEERDYRN